MGKPVVRPPMGPELDEPFVTLTTTRWANQGWTPHGFAYTIRFDEAGDATVLERHFQLWIGLDGAFEQGLLVNGGVVDPDDATAAREADNAEKKRPPLGDEPENTTSATSNENPGLITRFLNRD